MITRATDSDDDGSGLLGTIHNNAWLQDIYDTLDARWSVVTITATGAQADLDVSQADFVLFNNATDLTISGFAAPTSPAKPGKPLRYACIGAGNVFFKHQNAGSVAANRIVNIATSADTPHAGGSGSGTLSYDATATRWRLTAHNQGGWIAPAYSSGNWTASAGTWTVDSADRTTDRYMLVGRTLMFQITVATTSVSTTPASLLRTLFGFTSAARFDGLSVYSDNGGASTAGAWSSNATPTISFSKLAGNWAAAANTTAVAAQGQIEVT